MMNVVALAMVLSSLGSVMVLSPEPGGLLSGDSATPVVEGVTRPLERPLGWLTRKHKAEEEDHVAAAREKAADARDAFHQAGGHLKDAATEKVGSAAESAKETAAGSVGSVKGAAGKAEELAVDSAHTVYNKAYDSAAAAGDKAASTIRRTASGAHDVYDSAAETFGAAKEKTYGKAGEAKGKVYEGAGATHDAVVDNAQYGVDKTKGTAADASEKVKETGEHTAHETREAGHGIFGRVKDAACRTAECLRARAQEAGSLLPRVGQGVGYVTQNHDTHTADSAQDNARDAAEWARDTGKQSFKSAKDAAGEYYDEGRDWAEDTVREYYDEAGRRYRSARDYYDGPGSDYYRRRAPPPSRYYDNSGRDRYGYRSRDGRDYYDDGRDRYFGSGGSRWRSDSDYPETRPKYDLDDLGAVVEAMGWRRVGRVTRDPVGVKSSKEVVIGDAKYEWRGKGQPRSDELHDLVRDHGRDDPLVKHPRYWDPDHDEDGGDRGDVHESVVTKGARTVQEKLKSAGHAYEAQRSKAGEFADEARQELSRFATKASEAGRSWKDWFVTKPVGVALALLRALHLFTFSTVYGSAIWVTFVSGLVLSKHVPRQQFGYVQSRMFPVYLRILAVGQGALLLLHSIMHPWLTSERIEQIQLLNFVVMIASTLLNVYVVEPQATKVMFERLKVEKEEGRGLESAGDPVEATQLMESQKKKLVSINQEFKTLHGYSSALNLVSLGGLTCHLLHLANRLVV